MIGSWGEKIEKEEVFITSGQIKVNSEAQEITTFKNLKCNM